MKLDYEQCKEWLGNEYEESAGVALIDGEAYVFALDSYDEEKDAYTDVWQIDDADDEIPVDGAIGSATALDIKGGEAKVVTNYFFVE